MPIILSVFKTNRFLGELCTLQLYHVRLNTYTLVEGRQKAEGRRQKGKKASK
ncbi:MAG: hypothetical protein F6K39_10685, partial [Okeania sp. SIO3B3]|nr:hypothetical protein [Okeania sp. SIO3B3]